MADKKEMIEKFKSIPFDVRFIDGPKYHDVNKVLADLYFKEGEEQLGIYHLTEAHAASFRMRTVIQYNKKDAKIYSNSTNNIVPGLKKEYISFDCDLAKKKEKGMLERLREMPKEWTLVQITQEHDPTKTFCKNWKPRPSRLHISRLPCGSELDFNVPICVTVDEPKGSDEDMPFVFDLIYDAINTKLHTRNCSAKIIRKLREEAAKQVKAAVTELSDGWLREWRCLFLGELCNTSYKEQVRKCVEPFTLNKGLSAECCHKLYAIANGCAHLSNEAINSAVAQIVTDSDICKDVVQSIITLKSDLGQLMLAKRHPVLLIVDENLDLLPWEMITVLMRHPVSRVASIHFVHALFKEHQDHIVDGNRIIHQSDLGFYIINPDNDLMSMEKRLVSFLEKRMPQWRGITGISPSPEEFASALKENNLVLYCGHGSGTHLLQGKQIEDLRVVAMPLLFGCSSVQLLHPGGRAQPSGTSDNYLVAGSACVLGMLWLVTSEDTDAMTAMLLNSWLPGEPIDLSDFRPSGGMDRAKHEPELLRVMKPSRNAAYSYTNAAALVSRGIPIKMNCESKLLPNS